MTIQMNGLPHLFYILYKSLVLGYYCSRKHSFYFNNKNSNFVPISLLVTLEVVKFMQAIFIEYDVRIFDIQTDTPTKV